MCTYLHGPRIGGMYYFRRGIPAELRGVIGKREFSISLGVKDRATAKLLIPDHTKATNRRLAEARAVAERQSHTSAGAPLNRPMVADPQDEAREAYNRDNEAYQWHLEAEREALDDGLAPLAEKWRERLSGPLSGLPAELAALKQILLESDESRLIAEWRAAYSKVNAVAPSGGTSPQLMVTGSRQGVTVSIRDMFDRYAQQDNIRPATVRQFRAIIEHLVHFLGHDDAKAVTTTNLLDWRDRLKTEQFKGTKVRSSKTINDSYLAAANVTFDFGFNEQSIPTNPLVGVGKVRVARKVRLREKDFNDAERRLILSATLVTPPTRLSIKHAAARRWAPWLCAYTGARVNEITQLRKEDIIQSGGVWAVRITPEAGSVKTDAARTVPLHEHLIEQGFIGWVQSAPEGTLFVEPTLRSAGAVRASHKRLGASLAKWVRSLGVTDTAIMPNHAWRHTFKTIAREVRIDEGAADYMQGHASKGVGRSYGSNTVAALAAQLSLFPRFPVGSAAAP